MKDKLYLLVILVLFIPVYATGQTNEDVEGYLRSPEMADIIRFGNTPISKNAGRINMSIPLAELKDRDFNIQIAINYNSSGYMPMKEDGCVGLDWSLSGIGVINREVKGYPDDILPHNSGEGECHGFMYFLKNKGKYNQDQVIGNYQRYISAYWSFSDISRFIDPNGGTAGKVIEATSDIYHFNFGEHSGKFMINFDGSVNVSSTSGANYKVVLDEYEHVKFQTNTYSKIKIITDDGYTYYFGNSYDNMEYSLSWTNTMGNSFSELRDTYRLPVITSFHLYKITAPNGRVLNIRYKQLPSVYHTVGMYSKLPYREALEYRLNYLSSFSWNSSSAISVMNNYPTTNTEDITHTLTKVALVEEIYTDNQRIEFGYTPREARRVPAYSCFDIENYSGAKLSSVSTINNNGTTNKATLSYYYTTNSELNRSFLTQVTLSKVGAYYLDYNGMRNSFPSGLTKNIDYWNYWRGLSQDDAERPLIPTIKNSNGVPPFEYETSRREPAKTNFDHAMLCSVKYPTGGYTKFEYEQHTYNKAIDRTASSRYLPKSTEFDATQIAGGVRIKKVIHNSGDSNAKDEAISYFYKESLNADKSSGVLMYKPVYHKRMDYFTSTAQLGNMSYYYSSQPFYFTTGAGFNLKSYENDHITYPTVIEVRYDGMQKLDSTTSLIISPLGDKRIKHIDNIKITNIHSQNWWIFGSRQNGGKASLYIRGPVDKKFEFTSTWTENYYGTPAELGLCAGTYSIYAMADDISDAGVQITYKNTAIDKITLNGYTISKFTDHNDYPDLDPWRYSTNNYSSCEPYGVVPLTHPRGSDFANYHANYNVEFIDRSNFRGRIKTEEVYNSNRQLISQTNYSYQLSDNLKRSYVFKKLLELPGVSAAKTIVGVGVNSPGWRLLYSTVYSPYMQMRPVEFTPCLLQSKKTKMFLYDSENGFLSNVIETTETYSYKNDYLKTKIFTNSENNKLETQYTYSFEKTENEPYKTMKTLNILNPIVETVNFRNNQMISVAKNNYVLSGNILDLYEVLPVISSQQQGKDYSSLETRIEYLKHDNYGNPVHLRKDNSTDVIYLWGHSGQYPVAKIVNATYDQVKTALGRNPESISETGHTLMSQIEALRNISAAQISTYIYQPFGLASITDSRGLTTYYEYDTKGRLTEVYILENGTKKIIQSQDYKYVNE